MTINTLIMIENCKYKNGVPRYMKQIDKISELINRGTELRNIDYQITGCTKKGIRQFKIIVKQEE